MDCSNIFKGRRTETSVLKSGNYTIETANEKMGRIFSFTLRFSFGRLKDKIELKDDTNLNDKINFNNF